MIKIINILLAALLLGGLSACKKELDIDYHDIEPLTVIEAELTPLGIKVGLTLTTPMDEPIDRTRLTDATVTLTDLSADTVYMLTTDADGFYIDPTPGIEGHRYRLTVIRGQERHEAETVMYPPVDFLSLGFSWIKMPYDHVAVLQGRFSDISPSDNYFWVKIYRNNEIYQWNQINDNGATDRIVTFVTMTSRMDTDAEDESEVLYDGDLVSATVSAVSREMYYYLEALQNDSSGPAMFTGERCLGYFIATSPVERSVVFHPDEIDPA